MQSQERDVLARRFGGWILGNTIDGTQAEYARIPHAAPVCTTYLLTATKRRS